MIANAIIIRAFVSAIRVVQFLFVVNPKFQASNHFQADLCQTWSVIPKPDFYHDAAHITFLMHRLIRDQS